MKFLVDAQLPVYFAVWFREKGFDCIHTMELPDKNATKDSEIRRIAEVENRIVISKDRDFLESHLLTNKPEKLIFVNTGNIKNSHLRRIVDVNFHQIINLIRANILIEISEDEIIVHR